MVCPEEQTGGIDERAVVMYQCNNLKIETVVNVLIEQCINVTIRILPFLVDQGRI